MNVLVVASHPDDEILGAGGCIAAHVKKGDKVTVLLLSRGGTSRDGTDLSLTQEVYHSTVKASELLGFTPHWENFPDQEFDTVAQLAINKAVEREIERTNPSVLYTHHRDLNRDHQITHDAVLVATRPPQKISVYCFEVPSSTELSETAFQPNHWVDISDTLDLKLQALKCYNTEMRESPSARSISYVVALARIRGGQIGVEYAESFCQVKRLG